MKDRISGWKILGMDEDQYGNQAELQAVLTLGSGTFGGIPAVTLWWAAHDTRCFVAPAPSNSTTR